MEVRPQLQDRLVVQCVTLHLSSRFTLLHPKETHIISFIALTLNSDRHLCSNFVSFKNCLKSPYAQGVTPL